MSNSNTQAPAAPNAPSLPQGVDWAFVAAKEGARTNGYVPPDAQKRPDANSGVTVAHGFDLGGRSVADLRALGLPDDLVQTLTPYLGLRGQAAQDYLNAHPLQITGAQQQLIDTPAFNDYYNRVADNYNSASHGTRFQDLPRAAQTAIVDLAYQYGTNLASATPHFWRQVTEGRWQDAHDNLMDFHDAYHTRRRAEAALLAGAMASGALAPAPDH
ncbi:MAG: pesticin C-terminus-like muramidase [Rhizomicrobium sp.]|jgi:hypothetical protein